MRPTVKQFEAQLTHVAYGNTDKALYLECFSMLLLLLKWN